MILQWAGGARMELGSYLSPAIKFTVDCYPENLLRQKKDESLPEDEYNSWYDIAVLRLPEKDEEGDELLPKLESFLKETDSVPKIAPEKV